MFNCCQTNTFTHLNTMKLIISTCIFFLYWIWIVEHQHSEKYSTQIVALVLVSKIKLITKTSGWFISLTYVWRCVILKGIKGSGAHLSAALIYFFVLRWNIDKHTVWAWAYLLGHNASLLFSIFCQIYISCQQQKSCELLVSLKKYANV